MQGRDAGFNDASTTPSIPPQLVAKHRIILHTMVHFVHQVSPTASRKYDMYIGAL